MPAIKSKSLSSPKFPPRYMGEKENRQNIIWFFQLIWNSSAAIFLPKGLESDSANSAQGVQL